MGEKLYTLDEARLALNAEKCERQGHDYEIMLTVANEPNAVLCRRCGLNWYVASQRVTA